MIRPIREHLIEENGLSRAEEVLVSLRRVIRATDLHSKHLAKSTGLTTPQILLLQAIDKKSQASVSELAQDISLSQATVTTILDRLEGRDLVCRKRSERDKRKVFISLTASAKTLLKTAPKPLQDYFIRRFGALQDWEQTSIISALQRVASMMDAEKLDASPVLDTGVLDRQEQNQAKK